MSIKGQIKSAMLFKSTYILGYTTPLNLSPQKLEGKRSRDAISKQHGDVMPSSYHSEKMLWNALDQDTVPTLVTLLKVEGIVQEGYSLP